MGLLVFLKLLWDKTFSFVRFLWKLNFEVHFFSNHVFLTPDLIFFHSFVSKKYCECTVLVVGGWDANKMIFLALIRRLTVFLFSFEISHISSRFDLCSCQVGLD